MGRLNRNKSKTTMKAGDIYQLGEHRLAIGDSTDRDLVDKLMGEEKARLICTDPPYGVDYVASKKDLVQIGKQDSVDIANDGYQSDDEYVMFTQAWLKVIKPHLASYNSFYIFNSDLMYSALREGIIKTGFYYSQMIIWLKNTIVMGRKDYLPQHELIAYGWFKRHKFERSKGKSVMAYPKPAKSKLHPTMKPVGLLRQLIQNSTKKGEIVYEPFTGSGSTLIACEHLKRKCYGIEMNIDYVKTIIARWEKLTGKKAKKL